MKILIKDKKVLKSSVQKDIVSLFLHFQKLMPKPLRLRYDHMDELFEEVMDEDEFDGLIRSVFRLADHYFLIEKHKHPIAVLVEINRLAGNLKDSLGFRERMVFLRILCKYMVLCDETDNLNANRALFCVGEIFACPTRELERIRVRCFVEEQPDLKIRNPFKSVLADVSLDEKFSLASGI